MTAPGRAAVAARWGLTAAWMAVILVLSTEPFSGPHTGAVLRTLLDWLALPAVAAETRALNVGARNTAHLVEYGVLAGLCLRAWRPERRDFPRVALIALALCLTWAVADEVHQLREPTREGNARDVGLDGVGALLGILATKLGCATHRV